jgi:hypothetical protein
MVKSSRAAKRGKVAAGDVAHAGLSVCARSDGTIRMVRDGRYTLTDAKRAIFLDHVAATCNVRYAADMVGVVTTALYAARRRDPEFAAQWRAAIHMGYDRLEALLVQRALCPRLLPSGAGEVGVPPPSETLDIDPDLALRLLSMHRKYVVTGTRQVVQKTKQASEAETDAAILKKLRVLRIRVDNDARTDDRA